MRVDISPPTTGGTTMDMRQPGKESVASTSSPSCKAPSPGRHPGADRGASRRNFRRQVDDAGLDPASQRRRGRRRFLPGWGAGIRTPEWRYQKPLPYHLATPQCRERAESYAIRARKATARIGPVLTQFRLQRSPRSIGFGGLFPPLRANRKAAIAPPPSEYSSAW